MDYKDYSDSELYMLACDGNEESQEILYNKYKYILNIVIKKYYNQALEYGMDSKELYSDALLGFTDAMKGYKEDRNASFATFLSLCVSRRLKKALDHAKTYKNKMINESLPIDQELESGLVLSDIIEDYNVVDPLETLSEQERYDELTDSIKASLSKMELEVFDLLINGFNYIEISNLIKKTPKQVDNTIQRIKQKTKDILNK